MGYRKTSIKSTKSPRQERSRFLVGSILSASTRVLEKFGFERLSTNKIAEVAGVSIGSLYQYFPDKASIVASLIEQKLENHLTAMEAVFLKNPNMTLRELIDVSLDFGLGLYSTNRPFLRELFRQAPKLNRSQSIFKSRERARLILLLHLEKNDLILKKESLDMVSFILIQTFLGVTQTMVLDENCSIDSEVVRSELTKLFEPYLRPLFLKDDL